MNIESRLLARSGWILGALATLVIANFVFYVLGVANLDRLTKSLRAKSAANEVRLAEASSQDASLAADVGRIGSGRSFMEGLAQGTLKTRGERLVIVQEEISKLMRDSGLSTDRMAYAYEILPKTNDSGRWKHRYLKTSLQLGVSGSYPQVKSFVRAIQNSPQFFIVENISVSSGQQGTTLLHANLLVSTYFIATETDRAA